MRHVVYDTNFWKSFLRSRLAVPLGDPGSLSLFGRDEKVHRMLADHLTSERAVRVEGRGRTVDEWKVSAPGVDNHWLDGAVGAAVAASMQGAKLAGTEAERPKRRRQRHSEVLERRG